MKSIQLKIWKRFFILLVLGTATFVFTFNDHVSADIFEFEECVGTANGTFTGCMNTASGTYQTCSGTCSTSIDPVACEQGCANTRQSSNNTCSNNWGSTMLDSCDVIPVAQYHGDEKICTRRAAKAYVFCMEEYMDESACSQAEADAYMICYYPAP